MEDKLSSPVSKNNDPMFTMIDIPYVASFSIDDYLKLAYEVNTDIVTGYVFERLSETRFKLSTCIRERSILPEMKVNLVIDRTNDRFVFSTLPDDVSFLLQAYGSFDITISNVYHCDYEIHFDGVPKQIDSAMRRLLKQALTRVATLLTPKVET